MSKIREVAQSITRKQLLTMNNPWKEIAAQHGLNQQELVDEFQKVVDHPAHFVNTGRKDPSFLELIKGKRVALVGPSPSLVGTKNGSKIDDYDVVVRIQSPSDALKEDYGVKTDVIQSCLNFHYGPKLETYLNSVDSSKYPKFITCNDTIVGQSGNKWKSVREEYQDRFAKFGIPLCDLYNEADQTHDRWHLYWEVLPKAHVESFPGGKTQRHSANFNSGYGSICMLLRYEPAELYVTGLDFYNLGIPQSTNQKYHSEYIRKFGAGSRYGFSPTLHDQLSQFKHFINTILPSKHNVVIDDYLRDKLYSEDTTRRLEEFKKVTNSKDTTL